nr:hypothetical protein [Prevotella sp.]
VAHSVNIGQTDGTHTQILSGIKQGKKIITAIEVATNDDSKDEEQNALFSGPGQKKNNSGSDSKSK